MSETDSQANDDSQAESASWMAADPHPLPRLSGDLVLLHAPAFFDFRNRRDVYFPFLGTSGDVPITPLYEYFPVGFKTLQRYLGERGHDVRIINLSTVLLRYPAIDMRELIASLDAKLFGIDLHWMVHVQGSLALAKLIKEVHPEVPIIFGGISSTYYADELIGYPFVDMVMLGYDTHEPLSNLMDALKGRRPIERVDNLKFKSARGQVRDTGFVHKPNSFACGIDWSRQPAPTKNQGLPILELLSTQNAGCAYNCGWCGGSVDAFRRINGRKRTMARKPRDEIEYEFTTMQSVANLDRYHFYSVGSYNESRAGMQHFLEQVASSGFKSISYEQFHLTPDDVLQQMAAANRRTVITLSPESHDPHIARLAGRGVYSNAEMEAWIERALGFGIHEIDIWYFVGMPEQDASSVQRSVEYCIHLLDRFAGLRVNPMICPMIPFLDPGSTFFTYPQRHGYRVFHRTVEEHRRAMERASIINRINYETRWLSRAELVQVGFTAVRELMRAKAERGIVPVSFIGRYNANIDDALAFIPVVHEVDCLDDPIDRARQLEALGDEIESRNRLVFFSGVMNQAFPANRHIGGRWFDELGWDAADLESARR